MTTGELTERYLVVATRGVPQSQRGEFRRELAERIGDEVDARVEAGADSSEAEQQTLIALGDPVALVSDYLDRPNSLIGPQLFPAWKRYLRLLSIIVIPIVAVSFVLAQTLAGESLGEIVGSTIVVLIGVTVHLAFWLTLAFAVLDRLRRGASISEWTLDSLPEITAPPRYELRGDVIANLVLIALTAAGILLHPLLLPFRDADGARVAFFAPDTWAWLQWYLIGLLLLELVFWGVLFLRRCWSYPFAAVSIVLSLAFAIPLAWALANDRLFNHEFLGRTGWDGWAELIEPGGVLAIVFAFAVVGIAASWPIDAVVKARRAERAAQL